MSERAKLIFFSFSPTYKYVHKATGMIELIRFAHGKCSRCGAGHSVRIPSLVDYCVDPRCENPNTPLDQELVSALEINFVTEECVPHERDDAP
jgi:hypothetical protein